MSGTERELRASFERQRRASSGRERNAGLADSSLLVETARLEDDFRILRSTRRSNTLEIVVWLNRLRCGRHHDVPIR